VKFAEVFPLIHGLIEQIAGMRMNQDKWDPMNNGPYRMGAHFPHRFANCLIGACDDEIGAWKEALFLPGSYIRECTL
jgi:hypothetical protein